MDFYLPIAQVQISISTILILSFAVGVLSGIFGIGGGFLMTPILIFLGIPATYAVANVANTVLGISVSGATTHWYKKTLDYKMGFMIVIGGLAGAILGMQIFKPICNPMIDPNNKKDTNTRSIDLNCIACAITTNPVIKIVTNKEVPGINFVGIPIK